MLLRGKQFRVLVLVSCLIVVLLCTIQSNASDRPARQQTEILFLSFADPGLPDLADMVEEVQTQIIEDRTTPVHFSFEYLDSSLSLSDTNQKRKLHTYLLDRYRGHAFKLIITIGEQATALVDEYRSKLFPDASLVFFIVDPADQRWLSPKSGRTGVIQNPNYAATLKLALAQNPGTRQVVLISGSSEGEKVALKKAREQFHSYERNVDFREWTNVTFLELGSRLMTLKPNNVVIFLNFLNDAAGEQFVPAQILPALASQTNRPIYGTFLSLVGRGVVGGSVADLREAGRILGRTAASVLDGHGAEHIPVTTGEFQRYVFDWPQLRRWGISEEQLPPGSSVLHWQTSPWQLYHWRILGLLAVVVMEALLIMLLLQTRAKEKHVHTRLLRAQEELKHSQERFTKAFRRAPLAIVIVNARTQRYIDVNETFESWSGFRRDEVMGRTPVELGIWEDPVELNKLVEKISVEGGIRDLESCYCTKKGERLACLTSAELIELEGQSCILGVVADITRRKKAEQELQESEKRFRLMADSAPVLMWLSGPDTQCTDFNQEWLRFTGRTIREELGEGWTQNVHPDDLRPCMHTYKQAFNERQVFVTEYRLRRYDGQFRWVLDRGVPRFLEDGSFAGFIGCCIDITEEKEAKAARLELSGRLIHAQEEERARIAGELHDGINQELALLANGLQELERSSETIDWPEQKRVLHELWESTSEIANDIQHLSHRLHPSKLHYLGLTAAVRALCQEFSNLHKIEVQCTAHNVPIQLDEAVALSFYRTVQEALRNVAKHSQAHHVKVQLTGEDGEIRVRVSDDGIGFDPESARNSHGLGLISMQERLRLVGGKLSLWSRPSLGTQIEGIVHLRERYAESA